MEIYFLVKILSNSNIILAPSQVCTLNRDIFRANGLARFVAQFIHRCLATLITLNMDRF